MMLKRLHKICIRFKVWVHVIPIYINYVFNKIEKIHFFGFIFLPCINNHKLDLLLNTSL